MAFVWAAFRPRASSSAGRQSASCHARRASSGPLDGRREPEVKRTLDFNRAISAAGKTRSKGGVERAWAELVDAERSSGEVRRNAYSYNALLDGFVRCGRSDVAEKYFHEMLERGIEPDIITYNTLLKGCFGGTVRDMERSKRITDILRKRRKVEPDIVTKNSLINCLCKSGNMAAAEKEYSKLSTPNSYAASAMVVGYGEEGNVEQVAYMLWEQLERHRLCVGPVRAGFYNSVMTAFLSCNAPDDALALARRIPGLADGHAERYADNTVIEILSRYSDVLAQVVPDHWTCNTALKAMRETRTDYRTAATFVSNLPSGLADTTTFSTLVDIMCRQGAYDQARKVLDRMIMTNSRRIRPTTDFFNSLIHGLTKSGGPASQLFEVLDLMLSLRKDRGLPCRPNVNTITMIIDYCATVGEVELAEGLYADLQASHGGSQLLQNHIAIYNCILKCYREALLRDMRADRSVRNWLGAARMIIRTLERGRPEETPKPDAITFNTLLDLAVMNRSFEAAESIFEEMKARNLRPDRHTYNILIKGCAKSRSGMLRALEWLAEMKEMGIAPDEYTFQALVAVSARSQDAPQALHFFKKTELIKQEDFRKRRKSAQEWDLPHPSAYWSLMRAYASYAGEEGLRTVLRLKSEMESRDMELGAYGYATVINAHAERGRIQEVLSLVEELDSTGTDFNQRVKYGMIIKGYCKAGQVPNAVAYMRGDNKVLDTVAFNTVIFEAIRQNDFTSLVDALKLMELTGTEPNGVTRQALGSIMKSAALRIRSVDSGIKKNLLAISQIMAQRIDQT